MERFPMLWGGLIPLAMLAVFCAIGMAVAPPDIAWLVAVATLIVMLAIAWRPSIRTLGPLLRRQRWVSVSAVALVVLLAAPPLGGCSALAAIPNLTQPFVGATLADKQALLGAEVAFKGVSAAIEAGVDNGLIKGAQAAQIRTVYDEGKLALNAARDAQALGRAGGIADKAKAAKKLFDDAWALIGKASPS